MKDVRQRVVEILGVELVLYLESQGIKFVEQEAWDRLVSHKNSQIRPQVQADSDTMC